MVEDSCDNFILTVSENSDCGLLMVFSEASEAGSVLPWLRWLLHQPCATGGS